MFFKTRLTTFLKSENALLVAVVFAASTMIAINYFTIKTLSAVRAYSDGESRYSKGQKDAARNLIMFVNTHELHYWESFEEEINVPIGDSLARVGLLHDAPDSIIRNGFLQGRNHPDDLDDLIWVFRNFKSLPFMKTAIQVWKEGDHFVGEEMRLGQRVKQQIESNQLTPEQKTEVIASINTITTVLTQKEREFQATMGKASRRTKTALFYTNVFMTLLVIGSTFFYARKLFQRLRAKNQYLTSANEELDKFVYSASHDLRSPVSSLMGLVDLLKEEENPAQRELFLRLMRQNLEKQDGFLHDLIDFSRNKKTTVLPREIDLIRLVDDVVEQHSFIDEALGIDIQKDLRAKKITVDEFRLKIVLNNLLSNAIKYSDPAKKQRKIFIRTLHQNGSLRLEVQDNGLGIKREDFGKIFEMFYASGISQKSSGLGLFITHETVQKLDGKIAVDSEPGIGTTFTVTLPNK